MAKALSNKEWDVILTGGFDMPRMVLSSMSTPVEELIAIVVDPQHPRYGQVGSVVLHDWRESGTIYTQFADSSETFSDGLVDSDPPPQALLLRRDDPRVGILIARLPKIRTSLRFPRTIAASTIYNKHDRAIAKHEFYRLLGDDATQ